MKEDDTVMRVGYYKMKGELMKKYPTAPRVKYVYLPKSLLESPYFTFDETFRALDITVPNVLFKFHGTFDPKDWNCRLPERPERCPDAPETMFRKQLFPFNGYPDRVKFSDLSAAFEYVNNKFPECLKRNTLRAAWDQWKECPIMRKFTHVYGREYTRNKEGKMIKLLPPPPQIPSQQPEEEIVTPVSNPTPPSISKLPPPVSTTATVGAGRKLARTGRQLPLVLSLYITLTDTHPTDTLSTDTSSNWHTFYWHTFHWHTFHWHILLTASRRVQGEIRRWCRNLFSLR